MFGEYDGDKGTSDKRWTEYDELLDNIDSDHLERQLEKYRKKEKQMAFKAELKASALDLPKLFGKSRDGLRKHFEAACKAREKSRSLFGSLVMTCPTLVALLTERRLLGARLVTPRATTTGGATADVEVALSAADVQRAFVSCQNGQHGDEGNATIDFDEFLTCLALCGMLKYADVESMDLAGKIDGIAHEFLGKKSDGDIVASSGPAAERLRAIAAASACREGAGSEQ